MSHLSRDERLLALDGALDATRQAHLASCPACRTDVETLGGVLARVRAVDVPEPSPLFWDHLAARVGDAIAREPAPVPDRGWWSPRLAWAAAAVVITAAGAGYLARPQPQPAHGRRGAARRPSPVRSSTRGRRTSPTRPSRSPTTAGRSSRRWPTRPLDDEAFAPQVGQAELSISALSADERRALAGELAAELAPGRNREG